MSEEELEETQEDVQTQEESEPEEDGDIPYANVGGRDSGEVERKEVTAACRRPNDEGGPCGSDTAIMTSLPSGNDVHYECQGCGATWSVPLGGSFEF